VILRDSHVLGIIQCFVLSWVIVKLCFLPNVLSVLALFEVCVYL